MSMADEEELERGLAALEAGLAADLPPRELAALADGMRPDAGGTLRQKLRYRIARATIDNRLGAYDRALVGLTEARLLAADEEGLPFRSTISRTLGMVHAWRGRGGAASGELLRAAAEATAAGAGADFTAALAEAARASLETHRFDLSLVFLDAALASADLGATDRIRAEVNRMQCLNRLGRHEECLAEIGRTSAVSAGWSTRRRFLRLLEHARALAATGGDEAAGAVLEDARSLLPDDPDAFERDEWSEASAEIGAARDPDAAIGNLRSVISSFAANALHLREADRRLVLCDLLLRRGEGAVAAVEAGRALRIALDEGSGVMAERARNAILRAGGGGGDVAGATRARLSERYILTEKLGAGGYGVVHRAIDLETGAERAVKLVSLRAVADEAQRERLLADARAEIEAASRLSHPGIVRIHSAFVIGSDIVVVQDLIRGRTLWALSQDGLSAEQVVEILARLADSLVAMHDAGIVHRDLKPTNVMVDEMERPVVIDLGLATLAGRVDDNEDVRGSEGFVAPELLRPGPRPAPDPRQDVYAFGRMLEKLMPPAPVESAWRFLRRRASDPLEELRRAMTAQDPAARPASLRPVAAELDRALARHRSYSERNT